MQTEPDHRRAAIARALGLALTLTLAANGLPAENSPAPLRVSDHRRCLVTPDGRPFFWLADTAWALHQNLSREDVLRHLDDARASQFNVVQLMSVNIWALRDGRNFYGDKPHLDDQPWKLNPPYWDHLSWVIDQAGRRGLLVLLVYGSPGRTDNHGPIARTPAEAYDYGHALGHFFRLKTNLIWSSGIDVNPDDAKRVSAMGMAGWHAMAEGVTDGVRGVRSFDGQADASATLMTYHPRGGSTSSTWFHEAPWLDFNGAQVGLRGETLVRTLSADYARQPTKPVLNLEPWYEGANWKKPPVDDWETRAQAWQSVFAGACGHTYGHTHIYGFDSPNPEWGGHWREVLGAQGRGQMRHVRRLMESQPWATGVPRPDLLAGSAGDAHQSLLPTQRTAATGAADGSYALIYSPRGATFTVDLGKLRGPARSAAWYDPTAGTTQPLDSSLPATGTRTFTPPGRNQAGQRDWVLVLGVRGDAPREQQLQRLLGVGSGP